MNAKPLQSVLDQLEDVQRLVHKYKMAQPLPQRTIWHDLTFLQLRTLLLVKHEEHVNMRNVASQLHITASSASLLITRLVRTGWLKRVADTTDRRIVYLQLSQQAQRRLQQMTSLHTERMQHILSCLSAKDLKDLQRIFTTLQTSLKAQLS